MVRAEPWCVLSHSAFGVSYLQLDRVDGQLAELEGLFEIVANTSTTQVLSQGLQQVTHCSCSLSKLSKSLL